MARLWTLVITPPSEGAQNKSGHHVSQSQQEIAMSLFARLRHEHNTNTTTTTTTTTTEAAAVIVLRG